MSESQNGIAFFNMCFPTHSGICYICLLFPLSLDTGKYAFYCALKNSICCCMYYLQTDIVYKHYQDDNNKAVGYIDICGMCSF